jgi:hypothetical protein
MIRRRCRAAPARAAALLWLAALAGACEHPSGVAPPPVAVPTPVAPPPPRIDTPLPLPEDLLLAGRWRRPAALLKQLQAWAGADLSLELWLRGRVGRPSRPIDLQAPIEFFALWDGKPEPPVLRWAVSFALGTADPADIPSAPRDVESPIGLSCAEAHALGAVPLRMVCASSDAELLELLPVATRALPLAPIAEGESDAELTLRVRSGPLRAVDDPTLQGRATAWLEQAFGLQSLNRRGDAELAGLAQTLRDELRNLADDLDGASLQLSRRSEEKPLELSLVAPRAAARSELMQLLVGTGAVGIPPSDFWQLLHASEGAGYLWAFNAVPLARLRAPCAALLGTLLDFRGLPDRLQQQARWLLERLPLPMGPIVHATGHLPASSDAHAPPAWLAELGWGALSFAGKFSDYEAWTDQLASAFNDPILGPQFGRLLRSAWGPRWVPQHVKRRRLPGGHGAARGSFLLELAFAPPQDETDAEAPARAPANVPSAPTLFVLFAPESDGVKIAWAADEKFLLSLAADPARRPLSATLAGRAGLGSLHDQRTLLGGFSSLATWASFGAGRFGLDEHAAAAVDGAPHRGLSPILYQLSQSADAPVLALSASLGRETWEDLMFLIAAQMARP